MAVKYGTPYSDFSSLKKGYNPYTGMAKPAAGMAKPAAVPNYGGMRNDALGGFTSPNGLTGLEPLAGANMPGSSSPSTTLQEDAQTLYDRLLNSRMASYNSAVSSGLDARNASDDEARQRATIAYGMLPADYYKNTAKENLKLYPWLNDATVKSTLSKTDEGLSTTARLAQQYKDAVQTVQRVLASRGVGGGMYRSGETLYEQGRAAQANKQNAFDANQSYQDYIAGVAKANADYQMQQGKDLAAQQNTVINQLIAANRNASTATESEQPPTPRVAAPDPDIFKSLRTSLGR